MSSAVGEAKEAFSFADLSGCRPRRGRVFTARERAIERVNLETGYTLAWDGCNCTDICHITDSFQYKVLAFYTRRPLRSSPCLLFWVDFSCGAWCQRQAEGSRYRMCPRNRASIDVASFCKIQCMEHCHWGLVGRSVRQQAGPQNQEHQNHLR